MNTFWRERIATLPIASHLDTIAAGVGSHSLTILEAPPGTGKTTALPLALLNEAWLEGKSILVLQPRRLASRAVASRMADLLQDEVGGTVGYSVRLESKKSKRTRIEVITEGLLTRRLIADPELSGVGVVIFDEFHERSLHADVSLALTLETQSVLRSDLRIVVMSATLGESLPSRFLDAAWRYSFSGTTYPVTVVYAPGEARIPLWERAAAAIRSSFAQHEGDILVFLPGAFEITRTQELLVRSKLAALITPLFGDLPYGEQARAIQPDPQGQRKIVLATTIAETSITIEGVRLVIDTGLHRVSRVNAHGISSLETEPITRDAADQRAGRAGRTAPGVCVRLWSEQEHKTKRPYREPEVLRGDLTPAILDLAAWGVSEFDRFNWITSPPTVSLDATLRALQGINALSADGSITPTGKILTQLGAHPILGTIGIAARQLGLEELGASLIALLEERDVLGARAPTAHIFPRLEAMERQRSDTGSATRLRELRDRWVDRIRAIPTKRKQSNSISEADSVAVLVALAFPSRIARRRPDSTHRYLLASGRGAALTDGDPLAQSEFLATCVIQDSGGDLSIRLAAPLNPELFKGPLSALVTTSPTMEVDQATGALTCLVQSKVGALILASRRENKPSAEDVSQAFTTWLAEEGWSKVPFGERSLQFLDRVSWARSHSPSTALPDVSLEHLRGSLETWLLPRLPHPPSLRSLSEDVVYSALESLLSWQQRRELDEVAPTTITLPSGRSRPITYEIGKPPRFEARIQDLFGVLDTPRVGRLKIPATIHLLSPAHRPVQVTQDLASFWKNGYPEVRKELRGRYPKHKWPEDPLKGA